ncbi:MAG: MFS transporter [Archaeoglobaceae archaeon]|nr:MFS transporter [Archaeoglobaceae archaeon]MDW8117584.1 MFS transporter [Archaeoglobaceae archaeon]
MRINVEAHDMERSLRNFLLEGIFSQITYSLITVTIISSYLAAAKATPLVISILVSIPHLTTLAQIVSAKFIETRNRKKISNMASSIAKISLLGIAVISFIGGEHEIFFFAILFLVFNICEDIYTVTWNSWTRDLIPGGKRGEIISKRSVYGKIFATFAIIPQIAIFEHIGKTAFSALFLISAIFGLLGVYFLRKIENVKSNRISEARLIEPLKNTNFMKITIIVSIFHFAMSSAKTFFAVYILEILNYSLSIVLFFALLAHLSSIYSFRISGVFSDRLGNKPLFLLSFLTFSVSAILFSIPIKDAFLILILVYILHGFYTSAPTIAMANAIADLTYRRHSAPYYALSNWTIDAFSAFGCVFAGFLITMFYEYGELAYRMLFILSSAISLILIPAMKLYDEFSPPSVLAILKVPKIVLDDLGSVKKELRKFNRKRETLD